MTDLGRDIVAILPRLRAFARALARSPERADDLVQATCERALAGARHFTPGTRLDSWMFRIMRNAWIDERRRDRPVQALDDDEAVEIAGEDGRTTAEARLEMRAASAAIEALPEDQREVLVLVCVEGLKYREVADLLEVPVGTVMSRLARARAAVMDAVSGDAGRVGAAPATGEMRR